MRLGGEATLGSGKKEKKEPDLIDQRLQFEEQDSDHE